MKNVNSTGIKYFMRKVEASFEVLLLSFIYFFVWRFLYRPFGHFPYYGYGKFVLMGVYALLVFILFYYCESFRFGYLKAADATVAQWIAISIVNFVTYFQLCLISNRMLHLWPMLLLTLIDYLTCLELVYFYTALYHQVYVPQDMLMIYGNRKAITLKLKMDSRSDKCLNMKVGLIIKEESTIAEDSS